MAEREPRFGENLNIDPTNRLDTLKDQELPDYLLLGRQARERLTESLETEGWPEIPADLSSVSDLFEAGQETVNDRWGKNVSGLVSSQLDQWNNDLPDTEETKELKEMLSDKESIFEGFKIQEFDVLESLRQHLPEAWRGLIVLSSERQLAVVELLRHWQGEISDRTLNEMGLGREELALILDLAGKVGKYVDQAYVKQLELADAPGGSVKSPLGDQLGASRLYDVPNAAGSGLDIKTYGQVFPFEWSKLTGHLNTTADQVDQQVSDHTLPPSYAGLPDYLRQMAEAYGSDQTDPDAVLEQWRELNRSLRQLVESGCPLVVLPQRIRSTAANKVSCEIRLAFITDEHRQLSLELSAARERATKINEGYRDVLADKPDIPPVVATFEPFAFGPNLYCNISAQQSEEIHFVHTNVVKELAISDELPALEKMFGVTVGPHDLDQYVHDAVLITANHETAHSLLFKLDPSVNQRTGTSRPSFILEELKAESSGLKLGNEADQPNEAYDKRLKPLLGTLCSYLTGSSQPGTFGERYYRTATVLLNRLFDAGAIMEDNDRYRIADARRGIEDITELSNEIIDLYADPRTTPDHVDRYVEKLLTRADNPQIAEFIEKLSQ